MSSVPESPGPAATAAAEALAGWPIVASVAAGPAPPPADALGLWCSLEGRGGRGAQVRLLALHSDESTALIRIAPGGPLLTMSLSRVTRISVVTHTPPAVTSPRTLAMTLVGATITPLDTLAANETPLGLFLLCQAANGTGWQRHFYPRSSYQALLWGPPAADPGSPCCTPQELRLALLLAKENALRHPAAPLVDVAQYPVHGPTLKRLPYARARELGALPLGLLDGRLVAVVDDPERTEPLRELGFLYSARVVLVRPAKHSTMHLINDTYRLWGLA